VSAEALRAFTHEKVNKEAEMYVEEMLLSPDSSLDKMRYAQGFVAGLRRAVELQNEAFKGMDGYG
jgi:hypothetical protein